MIAHRAGDRPTTRELTGLPSGFPLPCLDHDWLHRIYKLNLLG